MALAFPNQWNATGGPTDIQQKIVPTLGNWLVAIVAWTTRTSAVQPVVNLADPSRNIWWLLSTKTVTANQTALFSGVPLNVQVWACPKVAFAGWDLMRVYASVASITGTDVGSVCVKLIEVSGMGNGFLTVDAIVTAMSTTTTSVTVTLPAPAGGVDCLQVAAAVASSTYSSYTMTGTGWTQGSNLTNTNPDVGLFSAWREGTTGSAVTFALAGLTTNWVAVGVNIRQTGIVPAQSNPNWPLIETQIGFGYDLSTPPAGVWWTSIQNPFLSVGTKRGVGYELGTAQAEPTDVAIRNKDGGLSPKAAVTATASAAGTATTILVPTASASGISVGDFFQLKNSSGVVKEFTAFKVTALSSAGGTTTVTFAAADGTAGGAATATVTGDVFAGTPVDIYTPYRILAAWGGKRHYVASGWAEQWPETWDESGFVGTVALTGTGSLANLTPNDPTSLAGEITRRDSWAYWPLSDPSGSAQASNVSGRSVVPLIQQSSKFGTGSAGTADFAASTQGVSDSGNSTAVSLLGDPGNCWYQHGQTAAELNSGEGYALVGTGTGFPSISSGVTVFLVLRSDFDSVVFNSTINPTIFAVKNLDPGGGGNIVKVSRQHNGANEDYLIVTVWDKSSHASTTTFSTQNALGTAEFVVVALTFTATAWQVYSGNTGSGGAAQIGSGTCNLPDTWTTLEVGGEVDQFTNGLCYEGGRFAHVAVFDRVLTAGEIGLLGSAMDAHQGDENTATRVQRKIDTIGVTSPRALSADGQKTLSSDVGGSSTVADMVMSIGTYEDALVFEDAGAVIQYRPPALANAQTPVAVLGERTDLGEVPYLPGVQADYDAQYLYNSVTVNNAVVNLGAFADNVATQTFTALDAASEKKYGVRTLPQTRDTRLYNPQDAWGLAYWLLSQYATRKRRIGQVVIDPASNPSAFSFCLTVEVGDLVTVMRRPLSGVQSLACVVLDVEHAFSPGAWLTTLSLAPVRPSVLTLNDPVLGIVGSNVIGLE